jgi:hypothetical protein
MEIYKNYSLENLDGEEWRDVEGYEGLYQVSNMGRVKGLEREYKSNNGKGTEYIGKTKTRILKQGLTTDGYPQVALCRNSTCKYVKVHKLVAKAFIPNTENKPTIDHISTVRHDNRVCNLRYFTFKEQMAENKITKERHRKIVSEWGKKNIKKANESNKKKVRCITTNKTFNSVKEGAEFYGIDPRRVSDCCRNKRKNHNGMEWEYIK